MHTPSDKEAVMEEPEMDTTHSCIVCGKPTQDGAGAGCEKHKEESAKIISSCGAGVPSDNPHEDLFPPE